MKKKKPLYLIEGSDETLIAEGLKDLLKELGVEPGSLSLETFDGEGIDLALVADACATPPIFTDERVVVLKQVSSFKAEELEPIFRYLENPSDTTVLIMTSSGGRLSAKLSSAIKEKGEIRSTEVGRSTKDWISERLKNSKVSLDAGAKNLVVSHLGEDVSSLIGLLLVLESTFPPGNLLSADDITPYLGAAGAIAPWDLTDAIDSGDSKQAQVALHRIMGSGGRHPLVVISSLHRHYSDMARLDDPAITGEADAAKALGLPPGKSTFRAKKLLASARRLGTDNLRQALIWLSDADCSLKGKLDWPPELVLEVLVARLCRTARQSSQTRGKALARR